MQGAAPALPQQPTAGRSGQAGCGAPSSRLFVGNLAPEVVEEELGALFATFGPVVSAKVSCGRRASRVQGEPGAPAPLAAAMAWRRLSAGRLPAV
jgi:hypothetical protein